MNASKIKHAGASLLQRSRRCCCKDAFVDLPLAIASSNRGLVRRWGGNNNIAITTSYSSTRRRFLSSSSKGSSGNKKPKLSTPGSGSLGGMWYTPTTAAASSSASSSVSQTTKKPLDMGRYGLKRLDYTTMKPPVWTAPPHPPTKTLAERVVFPASLVVAAGIGLLVYMNPEEEDMKDYWKRVESGQILLDDDDYDEDEYEYEDDDEE